MFDVSVLRSKHVDKSSPIVILSGAKDLDLPEILRFSQDHGHRSARLSVSQCLVSRVLLLTAIALAPACGSSGDDVAAVDGFSIPGSASAGLAFATVDSQYTSSRIFYADFATGEAREMLSGESGDVWLGWDESTLLVFNRDARKSLSYYAFDPRPAVVVTGEQRAAPGVGSGDPHDVLGLGDGRLMLAHGLAAKVTVMDKVTGTEILVVEAAAGEQAESLLQVETPEGPRIAVLHQGRDASYAPDGTQAVLLLAEQNGTYVLAKRIPLKLPNPGALFLDDTAATSSTSLLVTGGCTTLHVCAEGGFERVDLASGASEIVLDLAKAGLKSNGPVASGGDGVFFALTGIATGGAKMVSRLDVKAQTIDTLHEFPSESFGCCALFVDSSTGTVLVGDATPAGEGWFTMYPKSGAVPIRVDLAGVPSSGVFVPR